MKSIISINTSIWVDCLVTSSNLFVIVLTISTFASRHLNPIEMLCIGPFLDRKFRPGIWLSHDMDLLWGIFLIVCEGRRCRKPLFSYTWNLRKWPQRIHPSGCCAPIYSNELSLLGFLEVYSVACQQKNISYVKVYHNPEILEFRLHAKYFPEPTFVFNQ